MLKFFHKIRQNLLSESNTTKPALPAGRYFKYAVGHLFLMIMCIFLSCNTSNKKSKASKVMSDTNHVSQDNLSPNKRWMNAINTKDLEVLKALYVNDVYGLSPNGIDFTNRDTLISIVANNNFVVKDVNTIQRIKANRKYDYEIGSFKNATNGLMKYAVIWDTSHETEKRVLEFLAEADDFSLDLKPIHAQRDKWIKLCNSHNATNLINNLYSQNTMYYNHRPIVIGREDLITNYAYMNNADYKLALHPIIIEPVSKNIVYEIGQCKGSYNGKYILIWQKTGEGWQILFDSNI
ncbi:hypothetical protein [uncultured Croceitalea sp.]|uniref:hypothetical protein n=1 Tax=uncultured Croceitalea sp. TaxID=1798908 RepID=UPI003306327A